MFANHNQRLQAVKDDWSEELCTNIMTCFDFCTNKTADGVVQIIIKTDQNEYRTLVQPRKDISAAQTSKHGITFSNNEFSRNGQTIESPVSGALDVELEVKNWIADNDFGCHRIICWDFENFKKAMLSLKLDKTPFYQNAKFFSMKNFFRVGDRLTQFLTDKNIDFQSPFDASQMVNIMCKLASSIPENEVKKRSKFVVSPIHEFTDVVSPGCFQYMTNVSVNQVFRAAAGGRDTLEELLLSLNVPLSSINATLSLYNLS